MVRHSGGCRGRDGAPWCRHRQPKVWVLWTTSCLRLSPACIWLCRSGLWLSLLRTAVLSQLQISWFLRWEGLLWAPVVDPARRERKYYSHAPCRLCTNTAEKRDRVRRLILSLGCFHATVAEFCGEQRWAFRNGDRTAGHVSNVSRYPYFNLKCVNPLRLVSCSCMYWDSSSSEHQPRRKCMTAIRNKDNSCPTTNIGISSHILWPRFP